MALGFVQPQPVAQHLVPAPRAALLRRPKRYSGKDFVSSEQLLLGSIVADAM